MPLFGKRSGHTLAMHALVQNLIALVPPEGSSWPRPSRERWLTALAAVLDVLYEDAPTGSAAGAPVLVPAPDAAGPGTAPSRPSPFVDGPRPAAPGSDRRPADAGSAPPVGFGQRSYVVDIRTEGRGVGPHRAKHARR
jgi:hypothetical protein